MAKTISVTYNKQENRFFSFVCKELYGHMDVAKATKQFALAMANAAYKDWAERQRQLAIQSAEPKQQEAASTSTDEVRDESQPGDINGDTQEARPSESVTSDVLAEQAAPAVNDSGSGATPA